MELRRGFSIAISIRITQGLVKMKIWAQEVPGGPNPAFLSSFRAPEELVDGEEAEGHGHRHPGCLPLALGVPFLAHLHSGTLFLAEEPLGSKWVSLSSTLLIFINGENRV